jgi:hypothetical protein
MYLSAPPDCPQPPDLRHDSDVSESPNEDAQRTIAEIQRLLDEFDDTGSEDPLPSRVADLIAGFDSWCDLAIRRLHEIHRLTGAECPSCGRYPDNS